MRIWQKTVSVIATFALLFNSLAAPLSVLAQESPTPAPTDSAEPIPQETVTPSPTDSATPTATPNATPTDLVTPTPEATSVPTEEPAVTPIPSPSPWTFENVELNKKYQSGGVTLTFTKLPDPSGNIKIEEITLTSDQIKQTGSLSDKAYDITSDMKDGDFTYNLSLPIPESSKGKAVEVKFAEELTNIGSAAKVENTLTKTDTSVFVTSLDHFTIFILTAEPTSATITKSALVSTSGGQAAINAAVETAIIGLTPIDVTLTNPDSAASGWVRLDPIDGSTHIQFWTKATDGTNNWYDINVNFWPSAQSFYFPANYSLPTKVYAISDEAGSYPWTINLVLVSDSSPVTNVTGTVTVNPIPAANLVLTAPAATTITRSALVPETSGGTPTGGNPVVDAAIIGLTAIPVRLQNTGNATSANVRISKIDAGAHIQLWAKDTSNNWSDINVTGWIDSSGLPIPAGFDRTTSVYAISDTTGDYPLTVNLVNVSDSSPATASVTGTVTVAPIIHTLADFAVFDGVGSPLHANGYTFSSGITATYPESNTIELTGYAPIVTPWFSSSWTTYNYVTIGVKLPAGFSGTRVDDAGVMRYNENPSGIYAMGTGSTDLATTGDALGYLDYSFAANSPNTKKDGLVKLQVIWNVGDAPEYFTIDITHLQLVPDVPTLISPVDGVYRHTSDSNFSDWSDVTVPSGVGYRYQSASDIGFSNLLYDSNDHGPLLVASTILNPGESEISYFWRVQACDTTRNCSDWSIPRKINIDNTIPALVIISPTTNQVIMGRTISISGTATDSNFNYYYCYVSNVNGQEYGVRDASCTTTWHAVTPVGLLGSVTLPNDLADGSYVYHLIGKDKAGNTTEVTKQFVLDNTAPPMPTHTSPANNSYLTTANWTLANWSDETDTNGPVTYIYESSNSNTPKPDGSFISPAYVSLALSSSQISTAGTSQGTYYWHVRSQDALGNASAWSAPWKVTVDNTSPIKPMFTAPANNLFTNINSVTLTWSGGDDAGTTQSGIKGYTIRYDFVPMGGGATVNWSSSLIANGNPKTHSGSYGHGQGTYTMYVSTTDNASNVSPESDPLVLTYDATAPTTPTATPIAGEYTSDQSVTLASSDSGSGLAAIYYTIDGSTPNNTKTHYVGAITVNYGMTIKAIAYDNAGNFSGVLEAVFQITPTIFTPLVCTDGKHLDGGGINCVYFSQSGPPPNNNQGTGGQVQGISTTSLLTSWPKLAYNGGDNTDNNVLGTDTEAADTPKPSPSPIASPEVTNEPVNTNPGFMKWILTHKKISGGIALILLAVTYGLYRLSKKNK